MMLQITEQRWILKIIQSKPVIILYNPSNNKINTVQDKYCVYATVLMNSRFWLVRIY